MNAPPLASPHILVVEDDREIRNLVARYLKTNEMRVSIASDGREMDRALAENRIDLVVLDIMLPGEDGLALCRRLRMQSNLPVIILSARAGDIDRILGLEMGADDYLAKPFNPRELLARIRAVLRRGAGDSAPAREARHFRFKGWELDAVARHLTNPEGARVILTGAEFDLLQVFCERPTRVLSREQLIDFTQGRASGSSERSIDVLVSRLRKKLEPEAETPELIKTVRSGGYIFTAEVEAS
ncbi:response regulator [Methyloraptor flagellatus]|jgi:two-component system OmpR family response regulator|uniref:Regulatory protein VirG n=1 Tax=Methyloraptor flagellatus TaxID=3162530 RepID=A0AAU7XCB3_9HYPH